MLSKWSGLRGFAVREGGGEVLCLRAHNAISVAVERVAAHAEVHLRSWDAAGARHRQRHGPAVHRIRDHRGDGREEDGAPGPVGLAVAAVLVDAERDLAPCPVGAKSVSRHCLDTKIAITLVFYYCKCPQERFSH